MLILVLFNRRLLLLSLGTELLYSSGHFSKFVDTRLYTLKVIFSSLKNARRTLSHRNLAAFTLHLRNLLTHTLLFWHFLENENFELRNILE